MADEQVGYPSATTVQGMAGSTISASDFTELKQGGSPIDGQSRRLQASIDQLHAAIAGLEDRCNAALTPAPPRDVPGDPSGLKVTQGEMRSPLCDTIAAWVGHVESAIKRIEEVRARVEL